MYIERERVIDIHVDIYIYIYTNRITPLSEDLAEAADGHATLAVAAYNII